MNLNEWLAGQINEQVNEWMVFLSQSRKQRGYNVLSLVGCLNVETGFKGQIVLNEVGHLFSSLSMHTAFFGTKVFSQFS